MGAMLGEDVVQWEMQESSLREEKILVSVRLRPLSEKETAKNDASDWECINNTTIIHKNGLPERSTLPSAYCFDRVFGSDSSTKEVYKEGAKKIALSVLDGINSSVFAYGQTSSGKTYTMTGITEYTMADIYDHIEKHTNREFVLKFSAMEIYNEAVRDLISSDTTPLRLLDDPERGTVVEKLTEETLRDQNHLMGLLSICEAQRKLGETALNETSSRSHQILRMTVESSAPEFSSSDNSSALSATVNFVDLAGSERASQILSAGARLKEGCHINRSLLTLGTVIRKLSKGRHGHVPFRDSKLTRILQNSLGGNSRTAIICTMNPSHSQVEQSRNTLLFASCAKEVATKAQVNVIMSDKILVKHLQRELARMESELKSYSSASASGDFNALLKERELQIEKLNKEVQELTQQRDPVQSQTEDLLSVEVGSHQHSEYQHTEYSVSRPLSTDGFSCIDGYPRATNMSQCSDKHSGLDENEDCLLFHEYPDDDFTYNGSSPRLSLNSSKLFHHVTDADSEDHCKDVVCIEMDEPRASKTIKSNAPATGPEVKEDKSAPMVAADEDGTQPHIDDDENLDRGDLTYEALRQKVQNLEKTINRLVSYCPAESSNRSLRFARSRSCKAILANCPSAPYSQIAEQDDRPPANRSIKLDADIQNLLKNSQNSDRISDASSWAPLHHPEPSVQTANKDRMWEGIKPSNEGALSSVHNIVPCKNEVDTPMLEIKFPCDLEKGHDVQEKQGVEETPSSWPAEFERQRREIIELWDAFDLPLVHRTCFFLLFNGDPSDSVYMEVELRRLSFLKDALYGGTKTSKDSQSLTLASSARALRRERDELGKQVAKKFSTEEREVIYNAWGIGLRTKQRRQQLAYRLWTDTEDLEHARASASIVAKLVGFVTPGNTPKELFGLSFSPQPLNQKVKRWKPGMP